MTASANYGSIMGLATGSISYSGGQTLLVILCGGDKGSQDRDIAAAKVLAKETFNGS